MIAAVDALHERGNSLTVRWTPAHAGVEGNERVNEAAKHAAREGGPALTTAFYERPASPIIFEELPRPGPRPTSSWTWSHVERRHRYRPLPRGQGSQGASLDQNKAGRTFLPALVWSCGHGRAPRTNGSGPQRQVLVVRQWRVADPPSPSDEVPTLVTGYKATVAES